MEVQERAEALEPAHSPTDTEATLPATRVNPSYLPVSICRPDCTAPGGWDSHGTSQEVSRPVRVGCTPGNGMGMAGKALVQKKLPGTRADLQGAGVG